MASCPACGYPIKIDAGQVSTCAYCSEKMEGYLSSIPEITTPIIVGVVSFFVGLLIGSQLED